MTKNEKNKFIDILREVFNLTWIKNTRYNSSENYNNDDDILFEKSRDNKVLTIYMISILELKPNLIIIIQTIYNRNAKNISMMKNKNMGILQLNLKEDKVYLI